MCLSDHDDLKYVFRAGTVDTLADVFLWNDRISGRNPFSERDSQSQEGGSVYLRILKCISDLRRDHEPGIYPDGIWTHHKEEPDRILFSGAPVDLVQATSTVIFLWILSRPLLEKLERVKRKYGLLQRPENKEENEYGKE